MFGLFKSDPTKKLTKQHAKLQEQAMFAQRNGDMRKFAEITAQSEQLYKQIQSLEAK